MRQSEYIKFLFLVSFHPALLLLVWLVWYYFGFHCLRATISSTLRGWQAEAKNKAKLLSGCAFMESIQTRASVAIWTHLPDGLL